MCNDMVGGTKNKPNVQVQAQCKHYLYCCVNLSLPACLAAAAAISYTRGTAVCLFRHRTWERAPGRISSSATFSPILLFVPMLREATPGPLPPPLASKRVVLFASPRFAADAAWEGAAEPMFFPRVDVDIAEQRALMCCWCWCWWERTRRFSEKPVRVVAARPATLAAARTMDMIV